MSTPTVYNLGSLNIDRVLRVPRIVAPGETLPATALATFPGGKGANQSVALARAGARVVHIGRVGRDGRWLCDRLAAEGVDTHAISISESPSGQALIQVDDAGQNAIVLLAGANAEIPPAQVEHVLAAAAPGSWLLTQNETSAVAEAMQIAHARGLRVAFNPAPVDARVRDYPLDLVDLWCLNESEYEALRDVLPAVCTEDRQLLLTRGAEGAVLTTAAGTTRAPARPAVVVDTTAAGDTFLGYYLAGCMRELPVAERLTQASRAAAICVGRPGAIDSIPHRHELPE